MNKSRFGFVKPIVAIAMSGCFCFGAMTITAAEQGSSNGMPFKSLQEQIDLLKIELSEAVNILQSQIDDIVVEQGEQNVLISALQSAVATLEARVEQNEMDIDTLQAITNMQAQLIDALDVRVTDLEARVAANEDDISALVLVDQALQGMIMEINNQIGFINTRIDMNDGDISVLQTQVSNLQTQLSSVQAQLAAKQNRVNGICAAGSSIRQINPDGSVICEPDTEGSGVGFLSVFSSSDAVDIPSSIILTRTVSNSRFCTGSNYRAVGGGHSVNGHLGVGNVYRSSRNGATGWTVTVRADSAGSRRLTTTVVCARVQ